MNIVLAGAGSGSGSGAAATGATGAGATGAGVGLDDAAGGAGGAPPSMLPQAPHNLNWGGLTVPQFGHPDGAEVGGAELG